MAYFAHLREMTKAFLQETSDKAEVIAMSLHAYVASLARFAQTPYLSCPRPLSSCMNYHTFVDPGHEQVVYRASGRLGMFYARF